MSKLNISDEECILVQFPNENNELGIGFQDWLQCKKDEMNDFIQRLINNESETTMRWPRCDVGPANIMKKRTKDCEWDKVVVKILASGPWTIMCENQNSLVKYGVINPTRQDRRNFAKKQLLDENGDNVKQAATKKTLTSAPKNKKESHNVDKSAKLLAEYKSQQPKHDDIEESEEESVDDSSDDNFEMSKKSKTALLDKISGLTYRNKKLKEENFTLLALQNVSEIDSIITRVLKNLKTVDDITLKLADNTLPQIRASVDENSNVRHKQSSSSFSCGIKETKTELLDITKDETKTNYNTNTVLVKTNQLNVFNMADELEEEKAVEYNKEILSASESIEYKNEPKSVVQSYKVQLAEGVFIDKHALKNSDHSGIKKLTNDLLLHIFGSETLAASSLTGKLPNLYSKLPEDHKPKVKPMLDPHKLNACKDYVLKRFPNEKNAEKEFYEAAKRKCNNAVRRVKTTAAP